MAHISDADQELIEDRARDTDPSHWSTTEEFNARVRARLTQRQSSTGSHHSS